MLVDHWRPVFVFIFGVDDVIVVIVVVGGDVFFVAIKKLSSCLPF